MMKLLLVGCLLLVGALAERKDWALLVAGSNGWYNYRHQADVMHAYHIVRRMGIPAERVIVMMYDDIAKNYENPFPNKVFNKPNGPDVNQGVPRDYTRDDVTPSNFLKVLSGESMSGVGTGRTLQSGPDDHVFVYFADHGAPGLIAFPSQVLYANQLIPKLKEMSAQKKFAQLVFYVEACESGSMFENLLPKDINIYAMTAANGHESSWGSYCANPENLPCLGDLFSTNWMEDSDQANGTLETLLTQYERVKKLTTKSHVQVFGDLSIQKEDLGMFEGQTQDASAANNVLAPQSEDSLVDSRDVPLFYLYRQWRAARTPEARRRLDAKMLALVQGRRAVDASVEAIVKRLVPNAQMQQMVMTTRPEQLTQWTCHRLVTQAYHTRCYDLAYHPYVLSHVHKLANLCEAGLNQQQILNTIDEQCALVDKTKVTERVH